MRGEYHENYPHARPEGDHDVTTVQHHPRTKARRSATATMPRSDARKPPQVASDSHSMIVQGHDQREREQVRLPVPLVRQWERREADREPKMTLRTSAASAAHLRELYENTGALVVGRHRTAPGLHPDDVPAVVDLYRVGWSLARRLDSDRLSGRGRPRHARGVSAARPR